MGYDVEEIGQVYLSDPEAIIEIRRVLKKGGSLQVNLPKSISQYLDLEPDSMALFVIRKRVGRVYLDKITSVTDTKGEITSYEREKG